MADTGTKSLGRESVGFLKDSVRLIDHEEVTEIAKNPRKTLPEARIMRLRSCTKLRSTTWTRQ